MRFFPATLRDALVDTGDAHAPADAEGDQAILPAYTIEVVQDLGRQDGARGPYRVAHGDRPAYRVELVVWDLQISLNGEGDRGERLVLFDDIHIVYREP